MTRALGRSSLKSLVRVDTHVGGSRTVRAGSWWTAPAGPGPARPPRFGGAAPPAPSRPGGPGWAAPALHADTYGRAGRTGGTHSGPGAPRCLHAGVRHTATLAAQAGAEDGQEIGAEPDQNRCCVCTCHVHCSSQPSHLIPTATLTRYYYYHFHFTDKNTGV